MLVMMVVMAMFSRAVGFTMIMLRVSMVVMGVNWLMMRLERIVVMECRVHVSTM